MKKWETKSGKLISYKDLTNEHLVNILKFIKKRAKDGVEVVYSYGYDGDDDFMTGDVDVIYGKEVYKRFDYNGLKKEASKRKLSL